MNPERRFSADYFEARRRFRAAARARGAALSALALDTRADDGGELTIDIAWLGSVRPRRVLMHCSGMHGVEGFAGSAIQLAALERMPAPGAGDALVFVHALNPYGMARLRRVNENNVDLNRNFLRPGETWAGINDTYLAVNEFLNPARIGPIDPYYLKAIRIVLRHGFRPLQQAVAGGQYEIPTGLFFGGTQLEQGPRLFRDWLRAQCSALERLLVIDVHTGLGRKGANSLFHRITSTPAGELPAAIAARIAIDHEGGDVLGYAFRGGQVELYTDLLPAVGVDFITQEFGTYSAFRVLLALRSENYEYHHGTGDLHHPMRLALKEAFCPRSSRWRRKITGHGLALLEAAQAYLFADDAGAAVPAAAVSAEVPAPAAAEPVMQRRPPG